jgi:peptidoglycan hydrolase-like protein with peptidoglycan-binding domain
MVELSKVRGDDSTTIQSCQRAPARQWLNVKPTAGSESDFVQCGGLRDVPAPGGSASRPTEQGGHVPNVLIAMGARGELVRKVQIALIAHGFDPDGTDGNFAKNTAAAVKAFQASASLEPTARVDATTWTMLVATEIPSTLERSLQLTAAFEGHGFTLARGNWDGAGITWGIIGFTLASGELSNIILQIFDTSPALVEQAFGANAEALIEIMNAPRAAQMKFANSISLGTTKTRLREPWRSAFRVFGEFPDVQALQLERADEAYGQPSLETARKFGLTTELGRALAFDIHVQNGQVKSAAKTAIAKALEENPISSEQELRIIMANAVADASRSFKEDVRARKLTIAAGTGKVHGEVFVLANWGVDESRADA